MVKVSIYAKRLLQSPLWFSRYAVCTLIRPPFRHFLPTQPRPLIFTKINCKKITEISPQLFEIDKSSYFLSLLSIYNRLPLSFLFCKRCYNLRDKPINHGTSYESKNKKFAKILYWSCHKFCYLT